MSRPELHVLTDPGMSSGRSLLDFARAAFAGGADVVQLRDKTRTAAELLDSARALAELARGLGRALIVNDHLELAMTAGAHGVHLGPDDLDLAEARRRWPPPARIGGSARTVARARALVAAGADYLGAGPAFATTTKPDAPAPVGPGRIGEIAAAVDVPVIGIGGIDVTNAAAVIRAGASGVAVVAAVAGAADPEAAARALRRAIDGAGDGMANPPAR
jgi:thiamine-phosphate pyrophosphorylase